jgi:hypothetical protein
MMNLGELNGLFLWEKVCLVILTIFTPHSFIFYLQNMSATPTVATDAAAAQATKKKSPSKAKGAASKTSPKLKAASSPDKKQSPKKDISSPTTTAPTTSAPSTTAATTTSSFASIPSIFSAPPTPFGSGSLFGTTSSNSTGNIFGNSNSGNTTQQSNSSNFSAFAPATFGASSGAAAAKYGGEDGEDDEGDDNSGAVHDADESHAAVFKPLINLQEVKVKTMEEDEEVVLKL